MWWAPGSSLGRKRQREGREESEERSREKREEERRRKERQGGDWGGKKERGRERSQEDEGARRRHSGVEAAVLCAVLLTVATRGRGASSNPHSLVAAQTHSWGDA